MMTPLTMWTLILLITIIVTVRGQSGDSVKSLKKKLFVTNEYDKSVRPVLDQKQTLDVQTGFVLNSIIDFDEQEGSLTTAGFLRMKWVDEYLTWNVNQHQNIQQLFISQNDIWKPDMALRNSVVSFVELGSSFLNVKVTANGLVEWKPFQIMKTTCEVDITYFPFDVQMCNLKFTAWGYSKDEVYIKVGSEATLDEFYDNSAWELLATEAKTVPSQEAAVNFVFTLKRKSTFYVMNVAIPVFLLAILNVFTFVLPISSGERNGFAITVFLSLAVFLTIVADQMPQNSDVVSIFSVYLTIMTALSVAVVIICLLMTRLIGRDTKKHPIGKFFRAVHFISQTMQFARPCKRNAVEIDNGPETKDDMVNHDKKSINKDPEDDGAVEADSLTWENIVNSLDFLCFCFSLLYTFACTVTITVKAKYNS